MLELKFLYLFFLKEGIKLKIMVHYKSEKIQKTHKKGVVALVNFSVGCATAPSL